MSQYPQRVVLHQQEGSQLQAQLSGLRTRSTKLRPIEPDPRIAVVARDDRRSARRRTARIVFDERFGFRPLVDDDEPLIAHGHPLKYLFFVARIDGEAIVL
jgi:hypothetical protein